MAADVPLPFTGTQPHSNHTTSLWWSQEPWPWMGGVDEV